MGILNVTPDSFSDGGAYLSSDAAVDRALRMIDEGADIIDVGPESTRPGAAAVSAAAQIERAVPVIKGIRRHDRGVTISIDTRLAGVARAAIDAGADVVNDVSALRDDARMVELVALSGAVVVLMHMKGSPADMQCGGGPVYDDVIDEIVSFLRERVAFAESCGVDRGKIIVDPGIGFGKRVEDNLRILRELRRFREIGPPVLVGASRKRFIGSVLSIDEPRDRLAGSLACAAVAVMNGAWILRVHDVKETVELARTCEAVSGT
jgi:dihydropteroate synthase